MYRDRERGRNVPEIKRQKEVYRDSAPRRLDARGKEGRVRRLAINRENEEYKLNTDEEEEIDSKRKR